VRLVSVQIALLAFLLFVLPALAKGEVTIGDAAKSLPDKIGALRAQGPRQMPTVGIFERIRPEAVGAISHAARRYDGDNGSSFAIDLIRTETDSGAYALLTQIASEMEDIKLGVVGTASLASPSRVAFCKGNNVVQVWSVRATRDQLLQVARTFAATLEGGEDDIPVLVKHLPNWQTMADRVCYAVSVEGLKSAVHNQAVLDALSFEGRSEAVADYYGQSQLVIVEFTTPQFASDNDRRITAKMQELKNQGQPTPNGYRRVGNYSVFVFNAPDEKTANALIDQVKYEQVVQWLGDDPHLYERVQRYVLQKTSGVVIAVLESSGLSVLLCLGVGGLFGALLFRRRRRARQRQGEAYSDAGGMVRLNLDQVAEGDAARLLHGPDKDA
jgi:hypothetical protein